MFLFLLALSRKGTVSVSRYIGVHLSFGFLPGGTYDISISSKIPLTVVGLMTENEYRRAADAEEAPVLCNETYDGDLAEISQLFNFTDSQDMQNLNGTIDTKGVYYLFYHGCTDYSYQLDYELEIKNPGNIMDYRRVPLVYITPVTLVLVFVFMVLWLINWFCNFSVQIYLHYCFTAYFGLAFLTFLFYMIYIQVSKSSDNTTVVLAIYALFDILKDVAFLTTTQFAFHGWCYIVDTIKVRDLLIPIVLSTFLAVFLLLTESLSMPFVWELIVMIITVALFVAYAVRIFRAQGKTRLIITAHMLVIQNAGINPKTTPLAKKLLMYEQYTYAFLGWIILVLVRLIVGQFAGDVLWLSAFFEQLTTILTLVAFGFIFRIRNKDNDGYTAIGGGDGEEFVLSDIESARQNLTEMEGTGQQWEPGMSLPAQPVIVPSPTVIVIESPEGVEEVPVSQDNIKDRPQV